MKRWMLPLLLISTQLFAAIPETTTEIFGTTLSYRTEVAKDKSVFDKMVSDLKTNSRTFDPDCFYAAKEAPCPEAKATDLSAEAEKFATEMTKETNGNFNINRKSGDKTKRDFGGFIQGFVIDQMKKFATAPMAVNFSGDVYIATGYKGVPTFAVEDALVKGMKLATVSMGSGWMLGSSSPLGGGMIVDPKTNELIENPDFYKVVLFAKPEFSGARLDAWSTALIVGGRKLLDELSSIAEFKGQWGYMIVDNQERAFCSTNLVCDFKQGIGQNYIQVPW